MEGLIEGKLTPEQDRNLSAQSIVYDKLMEFFEMRLGLDVNIDYESGENFLIITLTEESLKKACEMYEQELNQ